MCTYQLMGSLVYYKRFDIKFTKMWRTGEIISWVIRQSQCVSNTSQLTSNWYRIAAWLTDWLTCWCRTLHTHCRLVDMTHVSQSVCEWQLDGHCDVTATAAVPPSLSSSSSSSSSWWLEWLLAATQLQCITGISSVQHHVIALTTPTSYPCNAHDEFPSLSPCIHRISKHWGYI